MTTTTRTRTILVVHRGLLLRRDDTLEMEGHLLGLLAAADVKDRSVRVLASDGHGIYTPMQDGEEVVYAYESDFLATAMRGKIDIVYVHQPVPIVHVAIAVMLRLMGATVVFAPTGMLDHEYAVSGWFRRRRAVSALAKRLGVALLRRVCIRTANWFVCLSKEEVRAARLPAERCLVAPWAYPATGLGLAALEMDPCDAKGDDLDHAPVAFVSRMDPHRKGLDRLFAWLEAHREDLPRPAVRLFAPSGPNDPEALIRLEAEGLIDWDRHTSGSALLEPLLECRGVMLLSRWEVQSRSLREALLLGLPVLTIRPNLLTEAMTLIGAGEDVDGADFDQIQRAYRRLGRRGSIVTARRIFDRDAIGRFLFDNLLAIRERGSPVDRDYYESVEVDRTITVAPELLTAAMT